MNHKIKSRLLSISKIIISLTLATVLCAGLAACSVSERKFIEEEFSIILDSSFKAVENQSTFAFFASSKYSVICMKESFGALENGSELTIGEYAEKVKENNSDLSADLKEKNGFWYFEYENEAENRDFYYNSFIFKGESAFYMVHFATTAKSDNTASNEQFLLWAGSIVIE